MNPISRIGNLERGGNALCGIGLVVHEEELDVPDVADEERLVARGGHVLGLAVGAITDLDSSVLALLRCFAPIPKPVERAQSLLAVVIRDPSPPRPRPIHRPPKRIHHVPRA